MSNRLWWRGIGFFEIDETPDITANKGHDPGTIPHPTDEGENDAGDATSDAHTPSDN